MVPLRGSITFIPLIPFSSGLAFLTGPPGTLIGTLCLLTVQSNCFSIFAIGPAHQEVVRLILWLLCGQATCPPSPFSTELSFCCHRCRGAVIIVSLFVSFRLSVSTLHSFAHVQWTSFPSLPIATRPDSTAICWALSCRSPFESLHMPLHTFHEPRPSFVFSKRA